MHLGAGLSSVRFRSREITAELGRRLHANLPLLLFKCMPRLTHNTMPIPSSPRRNLGHRSPLWLPCTVSEAPSTSSPYPLSCHRRTQWSDSTSWHGQESLEWAVEHEQVCRGCQARSRVPGVRGTEGGCVWTQSWICRGFQLSAEVAEQKGEAEAC